MSSLHPLGEGHGISSPEQAAFREQSERFSAFLANTNQKVRTQEAILQGLEQRAPHVWNRLLDPDQEFDVLYVGAGNGGLEIPLTARLMEARGSASRFGVYCEDPSVEMEAQFVEKLQAPDRPFPDSLFTLDALKDYSGKPFEDHTYEPPASPDFAVASHVWYYVGGWKQEEGFDNSLGKFAGAVLPNGAGLITLQSTASDRFQLRSAFLRATGSTEPELSGETLEARMRELGIPAQPTTIESETDLQSCFQGSEFDPTDEGKLLLSFMLRADWDGLGVGMQAMVAEQLTHMSEVNGGRHMRFIDSALWITPTT